MDSSSLVKTIEHRIRNITSNLLTQYKNIENNIDYVEDNKSNKQEIIPLSIIILEIIAEKCYQYHARNITYNFICDDYFACVNVSVFDFLRALSNIINNSVDAISYTRQGVIDIIIKQEDYNIDIHNHNNISVACDKDTLNQNIQLCIIDNGSGMSQTTIE